MKSKFIFLSLFFLLFSCVNRFNVLHEYNYKTIIEEHDKKHEYNHTNNISFANLCEIKYGFLKYPGLTKAHDVEEKLVVRRGPPFTFMIWIEKVNPDIEYIKFDTIELVTKSGIYDLLNLKDINYQTYIYYHGEFKEENYGTNPSFYESDELQILQQLKKERNINTIEFRSKGIAEMERRIKRAEDLYNEEEKKLLLEEREFTIRLDFKHLPINVDNDEEITVKVCLLFSMSNGDVQSIQFDNVYFREYSEIDYPNPFFIEMFPEEKNVRNIY